KLRKADSTYTLVVLAQMGSGISSVLFQRFMQIFGSPNFILDPYQLRTTDFAIELMQGNGGKPCYDLFNTNYILSFNSGILESFWSPVQSMRAYGSLRERKLLQHSRIVHLGPHLSITAAKADEWIPITPGTEGALALSICHVMIKEGLADEKFVSNHTFGFSDWQDRRGEKHMGFRELVLRDYGPGDVSELTGVPTPTIIRLAREFSTAQHSVAIGENRAVAKAQNLYTHMAIHSLNALTGNLDRPGGILRGREIPLKEFPQLRLDPTAQKGVNRPRIDLGSETGIPLASHLFEKLPQRIERGDPYPVDTLFLFGSNPLFSALNHEGFQQAFERIPFVVSFSPFMDESTRFADLILPDCTYLEKWEDYPLNTMEGFPAISVRQPVVKPVHNTKNTADIILEIAKRLDPEVGAAFPWKNSVEAIKYRLKGVLQSARGDVFGQDYETAWTRLLENIGWRFVGYRSFEEFWEEVLKKGGWWDPIYYHEEWNRVFTTPSGKFEFFSQRMAEALKNIGKSKESSRISAGDDKRFLPHYEPGWGNKEDQDFPLFLNIYPLLVFSWGKDSNQPWLKDISGFKIQETWDCWVEINPETAHKLDISEGEWVWVESAQGRLKLKAKLFAGTMPEVVNIPYGFGHKAGGRWSADEGGRPNLI
ncbi:MAG: molybdopterin-dependent oxidoreductase, partial [Candidatus Zixiibacteriota bacterium]